MAGETKGKKILKKTLKIVGWVVLSVILLLVAVALLIQLPPIQNKLTQKAITFLEKKIGTEVALDHISISFPTSIVLEGLYFEDQNKDTLLYAGKFSVDTDLWGLTRKEIQLNEIYLENCKAYIHRPENDSSYNFSYILKAFAGDSTATPDTLEQKGFDFSVEDIEFKNITAQYHDYLTGNIADLFLGNFQVSISEFNLDSMKVIVDKIILADTRASVLQTKQPEVTEEVAEEKQPLTYDVGVAEVSLDNIKVDFHQQAMGQMLRLDLTDAKLETDNINLKNQLIDLKKLVLNKTFISYQQRGDSLTTTKSQIDPEPAAEKAAEAKPWKITLAEVDMNNNAVQFYDHTKPQMKGALDFDHLWITNLTVKANDLMMFGSEMKANLENLTFREKSGFEIKQFHTAIDLRNDGLDINDLVLVTGNTRMQLNAEAKYPSLASIADNPNKTTFTANINETSIGLRDLLYFNPTLKDSLPSMLPANAKIYVDALAKGSIADMQIEHLNVHALSKTELKMTGAVRGLPDTKKLNLDINVPRLYTTSTDLNRILPASVLKSFNLPAWVNIKANYQGSLSKSVFNTSLASSIGSIDAKGKFDIDSTSAERGYNIDMKVAALDLGHILDKQDTIGNLNMTASINAKGLAPDEMNGAFKANIHSFEYLNYQYADFNLDGSIKNSVWSGEASMKDKNLEFLLTGDVSYADEVPKYDIEFDLKNINFEALHLSDKPLRARGTLIANLATADFQVINGDFGLRKVAIHNGDELYAVDSLLFASLDQTGRSELTIDSDLLSAKFEGSFNVFKVPTAMREYFNTYYNLHDTTLAQKEDPGRQYFNFELKLKKTALLTDILVPQLTAFEPGDFKGQFDSEAKVLDISLDIKRLQYGKIGVRSFAMKTSSDSGELKYTFTADKILYDSTKIDGLEFTGAVADNKIVTDLIILDSADVQKYVLGGIFNSLDNKQFQFHLRPDAVKLNYVDWKVTHDNYFRFGGKKLIAHNIELSNIREKIIIDSKDDAASTLAIGFRELNLEYLVSMINKEKAASGLLHGDILIVPDTANMTFTADVGINDFAMSDIPWGDVHFAVDRKTKERFDVGFRIEGKENNVHAEGHYITGASPAIDLTATLARFELTTIQPLTAGQVDDLKGRLTGNLRIKGSTKKPDINGKFNFYDVALFSTYLKSNFTIDNETIVLNNRGVIFDQFDIYDNDKNKATLDGAIETNDYATLGLNLNLKTDQFRLLNTTEEDNELFYGLVDVDATAKITGTTTQPVVDLIVGLSGDSHLTYVVPKSGPGVMEQEGIVRFVDRTFEGDKFMKTIDKSDTVTSKFTGLDLTARIDLTEEEKFTVVIDPTTGDQLTVRGNTTLTLEMDPTGDMNLSGRYEIKEGTYNLSFYKFVKREFDIAEGSTMTWTGDVMNAQMDLSAIYDVETAPIDLISNQVTNPEQLGQYKQRLPFQVYLNIKGQLLSPEISFRLDMPIAERNYGGGLVYSKLQDINTRESDLNKQVFALLILKRFISDSPFENQGAQSFEGTARTSVSKMLTEQLNRLSENVRGVELSFDVKSYEDYSSGNAEGQTDLQLGLSKSLFNDRLVVKVAGNVGVEGQTNEDVSDYIGDLALEYKLTEDGRFRIIGFRNSDYDMIDGQLTETGTGLIYVKDYNLLSELFKANEKNRD